MKAFGRVLICLAAASLVAGSLFISEKYLSSLPAAPMVQTKTAVENARSGYVYNDKERISDGIHTVNGSQKDRELEDVMEQIRKKTE